MPVAFLSIPHIQKSHMKFPEWPLLFVWFSFLLNPSVDFTFSSQETFREKELWEEILTMQEGNSSNWVFSLMSDRWNRGVSHQTQAGEQHQC